MRSPTGEIVAYIDDDAYPDPHWLHYLAWRFLNRWLHVTGDFDGLGLLPWYLVYRHMVRAKVDAIRLNQGGVDRHETSRLSDRMERHFAMALQATDPGAPVLLVTCGVSGSGKSWLAERLAQRLPAVWVRSDVERKRLFGMAPTQRPPADRTAEIYGAEASRRTYARLAELAGGILQAGYSVIADATYLRRADRDHLLAVAGGAPNPKGPHKFYLAADEKQLQEAFFNIAGGIIPPPCTYALTDQPEDPERVTVTFDGFISYTPTDGFSGTDTFTYTVSDGNGGSDSATVTVTVHAALSNAA